MSEEMKAIYQQIKELRFSVKVLEARLDALDSEVGTLLEEKERKAPEFEPG